MGLHPATMALQKQGIHYPWSDVVTISNSLKFRKKVGPGGLNGAAQACDLPIMGRGEMAELAS